MDHFNSKAIEMFHVEDEEDWLEIVEEGVIESNLPIEYHGISEAARFDEVVIERKGAPAVFVFDLRLGKPTSEHENLRKLIQYLPTMLKRGDEVFILSAFLDHFGGYLLQREGVPSSHMFEKGRLSRPEFVQALTKAQDRIIARFHTPSASTADFEVCRLSIMLVDSLGNEVAQVFRNRVYELIIQAESIDSNEAPEIGQHLLDVHVHCRGAEAYPQMQVLSVPQRGESNTMQFRILFGGTTEIDATQLLVLVYHRYHLIRMVELDLAIK